LRSLSVEALFADRTQIFLGRKPRRDDGFWQVCGFDRSPHYDADDNWHEPR
jgi:hypothetical protein